MNDFTHTCIATLKFGLRYVVFWPGSGKETVFQKDEGVPVSEEMKRFLEAEAVDKVTVDEGYGEESYRARCKFTFSPITKADA